MTKLEQFAEGRRILPCDLEAARQYGRLKNDLRAKGRPLPENDIWIAAVASHHDLVLATRDRHFRDVDGWSSRSGETSPSEFPIGSRPGHNSGWAFSSQVASMNYS